MRNSDPRLSVVFAQRPDSNFNSVFTIQAKSRNFQHGFNFRALLDPSLDCDDPSLLGRVYSRQTFAKNCSPLSLVMIFCPISTTLFNPSSMQIYSLRKSVKEFRSSNCSNRNFRFTGSLFSKKTSVLISQNNWVSHHHIKLPWSIVERITLFTHVCDCSAKTELICSNNYAKNSLNCFLVDNKENRQFSVSIDYELTPKLWHGKLDILFRRILPASYTRYNPKILEGYSLHRRPLLLGTWTNKWPLSSSKFLCK